MKKTTCIIIFVSLFYNVFCQFSINFVEDTLFVKKHRIHNIKLDVSFENISAEIRYLYLSDTIDFYNYKNNKGLKYFIFSKNQNIDYRLSGLVFQSPPIKNRCKRKLNKSFLNVKHSSIIEKRSINKIYVNTNSQKITREIILSNNMYIDTAYLFLIYTPLPDSNNYCINDQIISDTLVIIMSQRPHR